MIKSVNIGLTPESDNVDPKTALQIARVGAVPCKTVDPVGKEIWLGGRKFTCLGEISREAFMAAIESAGLEHLPFGSLPSGFKFQRVGFDGVGTTSKPPIAMLVGA